MSEFRVEQVGPSSGEPSPDMLAILEAVRARSSAPPELTPRGLRGADVLRSFALPLSPGVSIHAETAGDEASSFVPVRVYRPSGAAGLLPTVVFCHGGCFVFGTPAMYDGVCSYLAAAAACAVVSVDYRCAPEQPFPAALEDVYRVVRYLRKQGAALGLDAGRLALAGDSAGGNLAAVTSLVLRARGDAPARAQVLLYPITDLSNFHTPSYSQFADGFLSRQLMQWSRDQYLVEAPCTHTVGVSAARARLDGLAANTLAQRRARRLARRGRSVRATARGC